MKHPIPLHRRLWLLAQWPFSSSARETWYLLRSPANARHLLQSIEQLKRGEFVERDMEELLKREQGE
jgi:antitoxin YefM